MSSEHLFDDLAGAVLDGKAVDWPAAESRANADARAIVRRLRLIATVVDAHRALLPADEAWCAPSPWSTAPPERWGHLRLHERIGRGAFGEVFRAWDPRLDREVALKLLPAASSPPSEVENSITREGRLLAKIRHPNVVTIYGAEQIGDRIGLWMELVRGRTLEQELRAGGLFRAAEVITIGVEICRAVSAVHAAGLLHRDIKAQNVTRAEDGRIVLMDFGAGSELNDRSTGDVAGTPLYAAPEVLAGRPATVQSDIFCVGVLLYHLLTGSYPVRGRTLRDVREAHRLGERIPIDSIRPGVPSRLARVIERACDPQPERRQTDADSLGRDLLALQRRPAVFLRFGAAAVAAGVLGTFLVSEVQARLSPEHRSLGRRLISLIAGAPALERPVIAVLPFRNLHSEAGNDLLVDSVTTGLIRHLALIDGLQVRSQESSFRFRNGPRHLPEVGKRLSVNLVVDGDAQIADGVLRINASLLSVADGTTLWSHSLNRRLESAGDVDALTEELATNIVQRLRLHLAAQTARRYDTDIATLQTYLKGRALRDTRGPQSRNAIELFDEVIRADPSYAPAQAALAATYGQLTTSYPTADGTTIAPPEAAALMEPLIRRALEIDSGLAEAHAAQGFLHAMALRWTDAEASFRRAIVLEPSLTSLQGDFVLATLLPWGRLDESLSLLESALEEDPASLDLRRTLGYVQLQAGRYRQARDNFRQILDVDPIFPFAENQLRWALLFNGERDEAIERFERFSLGRPGVRGYIHAINGRRREAEAIAAQFADLPQRQAEIYGLLGDKDRALAALQRLAALNPVRAATYLNHPEIALRGDPHAMAFRQQLRFPQ